MSEDVNISFFLSLFLSLSLCVSVCVASFLIKMWQYHACVSEQKKRKRKKEKSLTYFVVLPNFGKERKKLNEI